MLTILNLVLVLVATGVPVISSRSVGPTEIDVGSHIQLGHNRDRDRDRDREDITKKFTCPAIYGRYPHPQNCDYYFECRQGRATLRKCNRGYLYDESKEQCRDKKKVDCYRDNTNNTHDDDKNVEKEFKCPYTWGSFAHPLDCSKYYVCVYKVPTVFRCHSTELFDDKVRKCLHRNRVNCGKRIDREGTKTTERLKSTTSKSKTTTERPNTTTRTSTKKRIVTTTTAVPTTTKGHRNFFCPFPNGRYADPEDCSRYYECRSSVPSLQRCKQSKLYDERKEDCREGRQVRCGDRPGGAGDDSFPPGKTTTTIITPSTMKEIPESSPAATKEPTSTPQKTTTVEPTTTIQPTTTVQPTTTSESTATAQPTTTSEPTATAQPTTTSEPTTTAQPTTTSEPTTTSQPTTTAQPVTTSEVTTTTQSVTTSEPTTTTQPTTTSEQTTATEADTRAPTTTSEPSTPKSTTTFEPSTPEPTAEPIRKPNTPPPTDCDEGDLDCIIDETGDVGGWFDCPKMYGHFPHGSSKQLFIHCDNWKPFIKKCADGTEFSPEYLVCVWQ